MDDDESTLLDEIGRFARQQEAEERRRFDERWRRLAAGTISAADDAALRALAEESEEARLDYEALRPFGPRLHDRLAGEWQARTPVALPEPPARRPVGERRWHRSRPYRWLAVAATLVVAVLGWRFWHSPELPALPEYGHELTGVQETRSPDATADVPVFMPGSLFRLVLRPEQPIDQDLQRRYYLESSTGELRPWRPDHALSAEGVVEIVGTVGQDLLIDPGDWNLVFVYGRPGRLPDPAELTAATSTADWRVVRVPFRIMARELSSMEPRLEVELAGCQAYYTDRGCVPGGELTLWVPSAGHTRLELRVGERSLDDAGVAVDGGRRFTFAASPEDRQVEVLAATLEGEETWRLELIDRPLPAWLVAGQELFAAGEIAAARQQLAGQIADAAPTMAALAHSTLARAVMRLGVPEEEILKHLEQAIELHRQTGDLIHLASDLGVAIYFDLRHLRFSRARQRLDELAQALPAGVAADARIYLVFYQAILERKLGNFRQALELGQRSLTLARRLGLADKQVLAEEEMALVLQDLGRFADADQLLRGLETAYRRDPCDRVRLLNNRAWVLIRAADPALGDPLPLLAQALELAEREGCRATRVLDVVLDQARAFVERGKTWEGLQALARAQAFAEQATPLQRLWWEQVEGLLALQDGRALDALASFEHLEGMAQASLFPEGRWLAKLGQAKAHRLLDAPSAALAALAAAEALLGEHSLQVPLHAGRGSFVAERQEGARLHLETLLDEGRVGEALAVARRSRSRLLRDLHQSDRLAHLSSVEQGAWDQEIAVYLRLRGELEAAANDDWRLSAEGLEHALEERSGRQREALRALDRAFRVLEPDHPVGEPPLRADQAVLVYHPLSRGWVGFAAFSGQVESHRFELPDAAFADPAELAHLLLEPFSKTLAGAGDVRILPFGRLNELDFHALPWAGDVFLAAHPVIYGLDLTARPASSSSRRALIVADPRGDLPEAAEEGEAVAVALASPSRARDVVRLAGDAATPVRLRELLTKVDLLHYAGHGAFAGSFGWDSALLLAGEGRFTLGDVLALDRAPAEVVLSSCEAARAVDDGGLANLGLAQAFVIAGSERVIAAIRPVGDRATAGFFRELYGTPSPSQNALPSVDLAEALRRAQLAWRQRDPGADWASFRLLEP